MNTKCVVLEYLYRDAGNYKVHGSVLLKAEPEAWRKANYSDALLSLGQANGKQAGLAFNASTPLMYFNAELVKKAGGDPEKMPGNWADTIALAKKIRTADVAGLAYNIHD